MEAELREDGLNAGFVSSSRHIELRRRISLQGICGRGRFVLVYERGIMNQLVFIRAKSGS